MFGRQKVGYLGNGANNYVIFNGINVISSGSYTLTIYYLSAEARTFDVSVNGGTGIVVNCNSSGGWSTVGTITTTISLNSGNNTIKLYNNSGYCPDLDRIGITGGGVVTSTPTPTPAATATPTATPTPTVGPTNTPTPTPAATATPTPTSNVTPTPYPTTVGAGVPSAPPAGPNPDPSLTSHALNYAPSPLNNPLKGFAYWYYPGDVPDKSFPTSLEWHYFGLGDVMTDYNSFNWEPVEKALDEIASHGKQAAIRFATSRCPSGQGIPTFMNNIPLNAGDLLPYDDPRVMTAFTNFIQAFGAKYDGDPRIGFIHLGLVGYWGEWHTWPYDGVNATPNYMPSDANCNIIIDAYNQAFKKTALEIRYPTVGGGTHLTTLARMGYHDDSWCYKEGSPLGSMTLPMSLGGLDYGFCQLMLNAKAENKWLTASIGGEVRPEIQSSLFTGGEQVDDPLMDIEISHATWMIDDQNNYNPNDARTQQAVHEMGYDFYVKNTYYNNSVSAGSMKVGVQIENRGMSPFYYGPDMWPVIVGLKDSSGNVVKTITTNWDLRNIMPVKVRAFPDWGLGQDPTYISFGNAFYFDTALDTTGLKGNYTVVMRVFNPLENVKEADVRAKGHIGDWQPYLAPKMLRFANDTQGSDGWLVLGTVSIN